MLTWTDITHAVTTRWTVARREPTRLILLVPLDGRRQKVVLESLDPVGMLAIHAEVCSASRLHADEALRYNARSRLGALAVERGAYVLRQLLSLVTLTVDELDRAIRGGAVEGARQARTLVMPSLGVEVYRHVFAHMAE
jgi:hypothetical protein